METPSNFRLLRLPARLVAAGLAGILAGCAAPPAPGPLALPFDDVAPAAAAAEELPPPPAGGYDWDVLARRAADRSGEAQALWLEAAAERLQAAVDTAWKDPQVRWGSCSGEMDEETPGRLATRTDPLVPLALPEPRQLPRQWETRSWDGDEIGLRVYVANPFVNHWLRRRGAAAALAKESEAREQAYAVYCEVRSLCLEVAALRAEIDLLRRLAEFRTQARDVRSQQAAAGRADALELIQSVTRLAALRSDVREKEGEVAGLLRQIAVFTGVPVEKLELRAPAAADLPSAADLDADALVELALARRPDLAKVRQEQAAAAAEVAAAQAQLLPWFDYVEAAYEDETTRIDSYEEYTTGYDQTDQESEEWQIRFAVNVPIFGWDGKGVRLARAKLAAAETRAEALRGEIRAEVSGVREDYLRACAERDRLDRENRQVQAVMQAKLDDLAREPTVKQEDLLAAREEVAAYGRILLRAERDCRRLAQHLESVVGGPWAP